MIVCHCGHRLCRPGRCEGCGATVTEIACWRDGVLFPVGSASHANPWFVLHSRYAAAVRSREWSVAAERRWLEREFLELLPCSACGAKWLDISRAMDLSSPESAFRAAWEAHNEVSVNHVQPALEAITFEQCQAIYLGTEQAGRCIVTLATGEATKILHVSRPAIKAYAAKCGADYIELKGVTETWWGLEKFRVRNLAMAYERCLFLDCDLIPAADCPDLFAIVPEDCVSLHDDFPFLRSHEWLAAERGSVFDSQSVVGEYPSTCLNTGVVMCSRQHSDIWARPSDPFPTSHCAEQIWIEFLAGKYPIYKLPTEFNTQWWMNDFADRLPSASIVHWANCKTKAALMQDFIKASV